MFKNIIKEIIIFLLLTLAIILILGVLLYEYVPTNKIVPETVSYTTPEEAKAELQTDSSVDDTEIIVTYQIDSTDLSNYENIEEYVPGKKNPFASIEDDEEETTDDSDSSNTTTSTNTTTTSTESDTSTNTGYLPDKGTK